MSLHDHIGLFSANMRGTDEYIDYKLSFFS